MSKTNNIGTYLLSSNGGPAANGVYTIRNEDGVSVLALQLQTAGVATIKGNATIGDFGDSVTESLVVNETTIITQPDFIDGLIITVTAGTVKVFTNQ
jgi:hypothetical protein